MRFLLPFFAALFCFAILYAQPGSGNDIAQYKQAEQSVTLLRNEGGLIPLKRLDTLRAAYVGIGEPLSAPFLATLRQYMAIDEIQAPPPAGDIAVSDWLKAQRAVYNLLIVEIQDHSVGGVLPSSFQQSLLLRMMVEEKVNAIFVIHGDGSIFQVAPHLALAPALLIAPGQFSFAPQVAAQAIFGGLGAKAQLMGEIPNTPFHRGNGFTTPGGLRLSYPPKGYVEGIDEQLMADSIRAIVEEGIRAHAFPGAQVLVAKDGQVIYHQAFGFHTYDSLQAVATDDIYDFASVTKISSGLPAAMKLYGEGKLNLDAPLKKYLPMMRCSNKRNIPLRAILAHNARLRPWIPFWRATLEGNARYPWKKDWDNVSDNDFHFKNHTFRSDSSAAYPIRVTDNLWLYRKYPKNIFRAIRKSPLNEQPGYVYSDLAFIMLPRVLEHITKEDFQTYIQENFYSPLGAATLGYNPLRRFPKSRIVPTERDTFFRMVQLQGTVHDEGASMLRGVSGHAGLFGSANDLAKLMTMYMNYGSYGGEQLIPEAAVREFTRCQYCEEGNRRALGFDKPLIEYEADKSMVAQAASPSSFGHSGYTGTFTWADPENGLLLIFFSNRVYPTRDNNKLSELNIRPRIHAVLYQAMRKGE
ncbi:MAG: serine hydrolase [Phaeodactylibacter sp.]|nr:serine hydrolase [Phaeodactylibacter sp.]MCB9276255.1 serine hydrolase [Lewinellaceae bacterium]